MEAEEAKTGINHHPSLIVSGSVSPLPKLKETRKKPTLSDSPFPLPPLHRYPFSIPFRDELSSLQIR